MPILCPVQKNSEHLIQTGLSSHCCGASALWGLMNELWSGSHIVDLYEPRADSWHWAELSSFTLCKRLSGFFLSSSYSLQLVDFFPNVKVESLTLFSPVPFLTPYVFVGIIPLALIYGSVFPKGIITCF